MGDLDTVLLDYGHGGIINGMYQTTGKQYHFTDQPRPLSIYEGIVNRRIAAHLATMLVGRGIRVFDVVGNRELSDLYTAPECLCQDDIPLALRVDRANNQADRGVYISIHANAIGNGIEGPSLNARGFGVYTYPGQSQSDVIAESIWQALNDEHLKVRRETTDGDNDYERDFYVLRKTQCPAVLTENGFFTNIHDAKFLLSDKGAVTIARAHLHGLLPHVRATGPRVH